MTQPVIQVNQLAKHFGNKTALNQFDLSIAQGGIHAVIGANGAGKSTLFRILLGFDQPSGGESFVLGMNSQQLTPQMRGRIGYVNEEHTLPTWMRVNEVIAMQKDLYPQWRQDIFDTVIGNFDVQAAQKVAQLSRGERAGLNLSMALAQAPDLLILDEPTLGLDVVAKQAFLEALMYTETDVDTTIVYCSHQMEEVERVAENLIIIEQGRVLYQDSPDDFCQRISYWITEFPAKTPNEADLPGLLSMKFIEAQYHLVFADQSEDQIRPLLSRFGANDITQAPITLERAINAVLAKNHRAPGKSATAEA